MSLNTSDLDKVKELLVTFTINNDSIFKLDPNFRYVFSHHVGWDPGEHRTKIIETGKAKFTFTDSFKIPADCIVLNTGGGVDIRFGKFSKRIYTQQLVYRGDWADPIRVK